MKSLKAACLIIPVILGMSACIVKADGPIIKNEIATPNFHSIVLSAIGEVHIVEDSVFYVEVESYENVIPHVKVDVKDGVLKLGRKSGWHFRKLDHLHFIVHGRQIESLRISGSGNIDAQMGTMASSFDTHISGSGNIQVKGQQFTQVESHTSGSGNTQIEGLTDRSIIHISGSGNVENFGLISKNTEVKISGSGRVETTTVDNLKVRISGSGDVLYKGNPYIDVDNSGSGNVINAN